MVLKEIIMSVRDISSAYEASGSLHFAPSEALAPLLEGVDPAQVYAGQMAVMKTHDHPLQTFHDDRRFGLAHDYGPVVAEEWARSFSFGYAVLRTAFEPGVPLPGDQSQARLAGVRQRLNGNPDMLRRSVEEAFASYPDVLEAVDIFGKYNSGTTAGALFILAAERRLVNPSLPELTAPPAPAITEGGTVVNMPQQRRSGGNRRNRNQFGFPPSSFGSSSVRIGRGR